MSYGTRSSAQRSVYALFRSWGRHNLGPRPVGVLLPLHITPPVQESYILKKLKVQRERREKEGGREERREGGERERKKKSVYIINS